MSRPRERKLRICLRHGCRIDHDVAFGNKRDVVAGGDMHAASFEICDRFGSREIAPRHEHAERKTEPRQGAHTHSADADKMNVFDFIEIHNPIICAETSRFAQKKKGLAPLRDFFGLVFTAVFFCSCYRY